MLCTALKEPVLLLPLMKLVLWHMVTVKSHASCIVHIIFSFWSFDISGAILRNQKFMIDLNSFSKQIVYIWNLLRYKHVKVFELAVLLKFCQTTVFSLALFAILLSH